MLRNALIFTILVALSACSPEDNTRRFEGAGLSLFSETQTPQATRNLINYFDQLCGQASIGTITVDGQSGEKKFACPSPITPTTYAKLMQTGFNDIDLRCDQYLGWIDRKRIEALTNRRSATALENFLGAGLIIGNAAPDAFAVLVATFGFARSIYDASNLSLLAALESSTIKSLVYKRQKAFRSAANAHSGKSASRESVVFALRNYLLICTPQTIVLDANTFSRDPSAGSPEALKADFAEQFTTLTAVTATERSDTSGNFGVAQNQTCKGRDEVFSDNPESYLCEDIRIAQRFLCFVPERGLDGAAGTNTTNAIKSFELLTYNQADRAADPTKSDGLLSEPDYRALADVGCQKDEGSVYLNIWEAIQFKNNPGAIDGIVFVLNACFPDKPSIPAGARLDNPDGTILRERVSDFRSKFNLNTGLNGQMTQGFFNGIDVASDNGCTAIS